MFKKVKYPSLFLGILILFFLVGCIVFSWQEPTGAPPTGANVAAPINTGAAEQRKVGGLTLGAIATAIADGQLAAYSFVDANNTSWVLDPSGNSYFSGLVGIGTTTPGAKLQISDATVTGTTFRPLYIQMNADSVKDNVHTVAFANSAGYGIALGAYPSNRYPGDTFGSISGYRFDATGWGIERRNLILNREGGLVGIGTIYPSANLHIKNATDDNSVQEVLSLHRQRSGATAPGASGFGSDLTFRLEGFTNDSNVLAAGIRGAWELAQTNDTTARDSYLSFATMQDNTASERMRISSSGRIGIGTTAPSNYVGLDIKNSEPTGNRGQIIVDTYLLRNTTSLANVPNDTAAWIDHNGGDLHINMGLVQPPAANGIRFNIPGGPAGGNTRMFLRSDGNVGIGTGDPVSLLTVASSGYLQFQKTSAGVPVAADCDNDTERGRMALDTTNNRLYICNGVARGWDYILLNN